MIDKPLTSILGSGILIFLLSFGGSYLWALDMGSTQSSRQDPRFLSTKAEQTTEEEEGEEETEPDTRELTPRTWDLFLEYEGEREEMLGIIRDYSEVNFRDGPGTDYSIKATPTGGALLFLLDRYNQWFRARTEDGQIGWIHKSLVRQLKVPKPVVKGLREEIDSLEKAIKRLTPEEFKNYNRVEIAADAVNLRNGPGLQFSIQTRHYRYEELRLLGKRNSWFRVQTRHGATGWVFEETARPIYLFNINRAYTLNEENIKENTLRTEPAHQFRGRHIPSDQFPLKLIDKIENWYQIQLANGDMGWIPKETYTP